MTYLQEAIAEEKCRACRCFHSLLAALEKAFPKEENPEELRKAVQAAKRCLVKQRYDCLGCEVGIPPLVLSALTRALGEAVSELEVCPAEKVVTRQGLAAAAWGLPGATLPGAGGRLHFNLRGPDGRGGSEGRLRNGYRRNVAHRKLRHRAPCPECPGQPPYSFCNAVRP